MKNLKINKLKYYLGSVSIGLVNGMFGAGGGIFAVWLLKGILPDSKRAHASAVAVILAVSLISAASYLSGGYVNLTDIVYFIPGSIIGSLLGTVILNKISPKLLKRVFAIFMIWAGWRLLG